MAQSSMMHIRIDNQLKSDAAAALAAHGLTISDAVRITLTRVVKEGGLPANLVTDTESYDAWFKAKVFEAMSDTRSVSHEEAMNEVQSLINRKRHA